MNGGLGEKNDSSREDEEDEFNLTDRMISSTDSLDGELIGISVSKAGQGFIFFHESWHLNLMQKCLAAISVNFNSGYPPMLLFPRPSQITLLIRINLNSRIPVNCFNFCN